MKALTDNNYHSIAAIVTWAVIFTLGMLLIRDASAPYNEQIVMFVALQVGFLISMIATVRDHHLYGRRWQGYAFLLTGIALVAWLGWSFPISFLPIYSIMWITLLPLFFTGRTSLVLLLVVMFGWYSIERFGWDSNDPFLEVALYATFHLFALFSSQAARRAEDATQHAQELNRGLLATQQLLSDAAKENERTRIARDLHDQLGHHMTALAINLQVASRLADGEVKEKVDQCHDLSKQLLGDVRKAVSTLREHKSIDVANSLQRLVDGVPGLRVHLDVQPDLSVTDVAVAEAIVRCVQEAVTNTLRHARASESWIKLWQEEGEFRLKISDNGRARMNFIPGNGLSGMRERIEKLNGQLTLKGEPSFTIQVQLPQAPA
ncbi:MAG: sensor histidine kinase [Gammaproteobacteria bacterium]